MYQTKAILIKVDKYFFGMHCSSCKQFNQNKLFPFLIAQVVSQYSSILSPMAVDAVLKVIDPAVADNVDLNDIKIVKKLG